MAKDTPRVTSGVLRLEWENKSIPVGSQAWYDWLNGNSKSFRFEGVGGSYSARKEQPLRKPADNSEPEYADSFHWYAYRRKNGKLHKRYIGNSEVLTLEKLEEMNQALDTPHEPKEKSPKPVGNSQDITLLENKLWTAQTNYQSALEQIEQLKKDNQKLHNAVGNLQAKIDSMVQELPSGVCNHDWDAAVILNELKGRNKKSKATLSDVSTILEILENE